MIGGGGWEGVGPGEYTRAESQFRDVNLVPNFSGHYFLQEMKC